MHDDSQPLNRRAWLRTGCAQCVALAAWLATPAAAQSPAPTPTGEPDAFPIRLARPSLDSDEGGIWDLMDREEARLRRSPFVVRDTALNTFLSEMVCRLGGEHCADVRVHVVRTPLFNATMSPNGMMQIWTGLLLRVENEAQLAAVLGHELAHYLERHALEQLQDAKSRSAFAQFIGLFGAVGALAQLGLLAGAFAFSREHETRADRLGMRLMKRASYDGQEAAKVWDNLLGELKVTGGEDAGKKSPMFATHPPVAERRDTLLALAGGASGDRGVQGLRAVLAPHRLHWLQDEIKRGQFEESLVLFDRLLAQHSTDAPLLLSRGEVFRQRARPDDLPRALQDLSAAAALPDVPPEVHRSLAFVHRQREDKSAAIASFERYLQLSPQAADAPLIQRYLSELKT
jgi:tetratricopeptide (TPR) repeat protein